MARAAYRFSAAKARRARARPAGAATSRVRRRGFAAAIFGTGGSLRHYTSMRVIAATTAVLLLSSCTSGIVPRTPDRHIADEVERRLSRLPCVGEINRWERHYEFASKPSAWAEVATLGQSDRWYDYTRVKISFYEAGFAEFRARRVFHRGEGPAGIDDREYSLVFGDYDLTTKDLSVWACGLNIGGSGSPDKPIFVP